MPIVYVLTNPAFPGYVKVGKTTNLEQRLRQLDNTSIPLPFRCVYAVEVDNDVQVERLIHQVFADRRTRRTREFFEIEAQYAIAALKLARGSDVTPKTDVAEDEEGVKALEKAEQRISKNTKRTFQDAELREGDTLYFANNEEITAQVAKSNKVLFEGKEMSLSKSALILLHREGYTWPSVSGWRFWMFDNETILDRAERLAREKAQEAEDEEDQADMDE
ncbi:MAG: GIY-YIG nuclease family protein [Rhodobacteraceae bacterium]|nr:GIY-YIG nuclease family protein [Paracoccaceae bacterium]